jgi:septal ring-binding cell division protein DamX
LSIEETLALEEHTPDDLKPEVRGQKNRQRPERKTNVSDNHPEQTLEAPVIKNNPPVREQNSGAPEATRH